jgi:predicted AAA+ superfamily ATPase
MKKRLLYFEILKQINHKNALLITGMRQVGKTTIMRQVYDKLDEKKIWFDFDNPLDQKIFEDINYNNIYIYLERELSLKKNERMFVFIDEIQNFPEITKIIKYLIDHYRVKFIVTGSSSFYLRNLFPESLSGRKFLYHLDPLSFQEFLYFNDLKEIEDIEKIDINKAVEPISLIKYKKYDRYYHEYLNFGGFPEVVVTRLNDTKKQILKNIFSSFFEKDLQILSDYKDIRELRDLILLLVPRVGSMIDVTRIASELEVNRPKIYEYLEFLRSTFFIKLIPKFSRSIDRSVAGGKKIYFADNGILRIIGDVNASQLFENMICNQLSKYGEISFYNKRNTSEVDFIIDKKISLEVKLSGVEKDFLKLKEISDKINIKKSFIISKKYSQNKNILSAFGF